MLYTDDKVKAFAKDLKTYNGTTLQYVGLVFQHLRAFYFLTTPIILSLPTLLTSPNIS